MRQVLIGVVALVLALRVSADTVPVNTAAAAAGGVAVTAAPAAEEDRLGVLVSPLEAADFGAAQSEDAEEGYLSSLGRADVPLPAAAWLFGSALIGIVAVSRRRPDKFFG